MNILITGGAGYIGGAVARMLLDRGDSVLIYDKRTPRILPPGAEFVKGDLADAARLEEAFDSQPLDGVMHFAALIEAGESMKKPALYFRGNAAATLNLLETMIRKNVMRLVFSSTAAVYGEPASVPIREDAALEPTNPYGESKLMVERMLAWMNRIHGLRYASLRYFNVAGAIRGWGEAHEPESHLIPLILEAAMGRRGAVAIFGQDYPTPDGTCIRDYIHLADLADAHLLALNALSERERMIYNLGNGRGFSVREVIEAARRVTGRPIAIEEKPRRAGDPAVLVASSQKIATELGWRPRHTALDGIVASAWEWRRALEHSLP